MKVAIVEDIRPHQEILERYVHEWADQRQQSLQLFCYETAEQFLFAWEASSDFDLLFLDIQMPGLDGISLARTIRAQNENVLLVFTTGVAESMREGYEVEALHYLLKPLRREEIGRCLDRALHKRRGVQFLMVHTEEGVLKLDQSSITYIEARGHSAIVGLAFHEPVEVRENLAQLEAQLDEGEYETCHRSYRCRLAAIAYIDKIWVHFDDGSRVSVSRRRLTKLSQAFIEYHRGKSV